MTAQAPVEVAGARRARLQCYSCLTTELGRAGAVLFKPHESFALGFHAAIGALVGTVGFLWGFESHWQGGRLLVATMAPAAVVGYLVNRFEWEVVPLSFWLGAPERRALIALWAWIPAALWFGLNFVLAEAPSRHFFWSVFLGDRQCGEYHGLCSPQFVMTAPLLGGVAYAAAGWATRAGRHVGR